MQVSFEAQTGRVTTQDTLLLAKRGLLEVSRAAEQLNNCMVRFMELHKAVCDTTLLKPKSHWAMDIPQQIVRDRMVIDAFVIERQHILVKGIADHVKNTSHFDDSVLASTFQLQLRNARKLTLGDGLLGRCNFLQGFPGVRVANKISIHSNTMDVDEIVCNQHLEAATIVACAAEADNLFLFVAPLALGERVTEHASRFRLDARPELRVWRAVDVTQCLAWSPAPDGSVLVLRR